MKLTKNQKSNVLKEMRNFANHVESQISMVEEICYALELDEDIYYDQILKIVKENWNKI